MKEKFITKATATYGIGDALNLRAFLIRYCKEKGIPHNKICVYTNKHQWVFEGLSFTMGIIEDDFKDLVQYRNFGCLDLKKKQKFEELDKNIAVNAGIDYSFEVCVPFKRFTIPNIKLPKKYITLNTGFGALSGKISCDEYICTKSWPIDYWKYFVKNIGVSCVQIGCAGSKQIDGAIFLAGKLNIKESAEVMRGGLFHIDMEGGLSILNQHLGKKSVVLFGPTAIQNQGRIFNLNISAHSCTPCYEWAGHRRDRLHFKRTNLPCDLSCMLSIKPDFVINEINKTDWLNNGAFIENKFMENL